MRSIDVPDISYDDVPDNHAMKGKNTTISSHLSATLFKVTFAPAEK